MGIEVQHTSIHFLTVQDRRSSAGILSAMPKTHHHYYLHRVVMRRNRYISWCYSQGRRPIVRHV